MKLLKHTRTLSLFILGLFLCNQLTVNAQNNKQEIVNYAAQFLTNTSNAIRVPNKCFVLDDSKTNPNYLVKFNTSGFVILSKKDTDISVFAFSDTNEFILEDNPLLRNKKGNTVQIPFSVDNLNTKLQETNKNAKNTNSNIPPFLTDVWGGVNCYNINGQTIFPSNYYTPYHCSPGCVAISTSQVLHYYEWPKLGVGNNVYSDNYNGNLRRHEAFFDNTHYDWANMLDKYMHTASTITQQKAVGKLMYQVGVAVKMNYEPSGSTNNLNNIPFTLENFFRFTGHYESVNWSEFWSRLYESMQQKRPVPVAVDASSTGDGHVFVANGYKYENNKNYYYVNWGWWNAYGLNGYYNLQGWTSSTDGYNTIIGGIFDMLPEPHITSVEPTGNGNDFLVKWIVSDKITWDEFTLEQKIDNGSWEVVADDITDTEYEIHNPSGTVYQLRVKGKTGGSYYANSYSEIEVYATQNWYNGYGTFEGSQHVFARQTPGNDLDFSGDYTFETWLKITNNNQDNDVILDQKDVFGLTITNVTSSEYAVKFKSHATGEALSSTASGSMLQVGLWQHIAISKTGNQTRLYVNGVQRASYTGNNLNLNASNNALNIGEKYWGSYSNFIKADYDQLRISKIGRYSSNFSPTRDHQFATDPETIAYFTFQNVHRVRLKDQANNLSVIATNGNGFVTWNFEESIGSLTLEEQKILNEIVQIFPNPTTNRITILHKSNSKFDLNSFSYYLYTNNGKYIGRKITKKNNTSTIDLSDLSSGIYILKLKSKDFVASKIIIKQ